VTVLKDKEAPLEIAWAAMKVREKYGVGEDDVYIVDAEHEELSAGSYGISAECLMDWDWMSEVEIEGWWTEKATGWCLAVHPK
jgi:hypothetical protein